MDSVSQEDLDDYFSVAEKYNEALATDVITDNQMVSILSHYDEILDFIEENKKNNLVPTILLHSCCAPCSSHVIDVLSKHFNITILYYKQYKIC